MTDGIAATETALQETFQKIASSASVSGAESLCNLLAFLVRHHGEPMKETQIAADVFNKTENFDPRQDSTVRVQTSRLRAKLTDYYLSEGASDPWILEIPKGSYAIALRARDVAPAPIAAPVPIPRTISPWLYALGGFAAGVLMTWLALTKIS